MKGTIAQDATHIEILSRVNYVSMHQGFTEDLPQPDSTLGIRERAVTDRVSLYL